MPERPYRLYLAAKTAAAFTPRGEAMLDCAIARVAHESWAPPSRLRFTHDQQWMICLCVRGSATLITERGTSESVPGTITVFSPHEHCELSVDGQEPWEMRLITGSGFGLRDLMQQHLGLRSQVLHISNAHRYEHLHAGLLATAQAGGPHLQTIGDMSLRILILTIHQGLVTAGSDGSGARATFVRCKALIDQEFRELKSATDIAARCEVNRAYLSRLFRTYGGDSPYGYLLRLKLGHAALLLTTTNRTLQSIGQEIGYSDAFSFSKAFTRHYLVPPSTYRQRMVWHADDLVAGT